MTDTVRDRHTIEQIKDAITLKKWRQLTEPEQRQLLVTIQSPHLNDKEIYSRYLAIKKESRCPFTSSTNDATKQSATQKPALSGAA